MKGRDWQWNTISTSNNHLWKAFLGLEVDFQQVFNHPLLNLPAASLIFSFCMAASTQCPHALHLVLSPRTGERKGAKRQNNKKLIEARNTKPTSKIKLCFMSPHFGLLFINLSAVCICYPKLMVQKKNSNSLILYNNVNTNNLSI